MNSPSPQSENTRKQRLMRLGFAVTGFGLLGLMAAGIVLIKGAGGSLLTVAVLAVAGLLVTAAGFGTMVVASDPFADGAIDSDSSAAHVPGD